MPVVAVFVDRAIVLDLEELPNQKEGQRREEAPEDDLAWACTALLLWLIVIHWLAPPRFRDAAASLLQLLRQFWFHPLASLRAFQVSAIVLTRVSRDISEGYLSAVGYVALASSSLEHALHDAIAEAFEERRNAIEPLLRDRSASNLVLTFGQVYADAPGIDALVERMKISFGARNSFLHGHHIYQFGVPSQRAGIYLQNRKNPGKARRRPSVLELRKLANTMRDDAWTVFTIATLEPFGYDQDKFDAAFEP